MAGVKESTIASMLRHRGTALVRCYPNLSPSYLQIVVEKVSAFAKAEVKEPTKSERKQESELVKAPETPEALTPIPTGLEPENHVRGSRV